MADTASGSDGAGGADGAGSPQAAAGTVLVTGGAGRIGTYLRHRLRRPGRVLRLLDLRHAGGEPEEGVELVEGSITDPGAMAAAAAGTSAVVHLGGIANAQAAVTDLLHTNIAGTATVFEAARLQGVPRVVFASSNHAAGFGAYGRAHGGPLPRPDSFYGVTKVFGEALGSLYHDTYGMHVVCLRIGSCTDRPRNPRALRTWLSPDDTGRLVEAALTHPDPGFTIVWGVSDNRRRTWPLEAGHRLGFHPADDAEEYAAEVAAGQ